MARGQSPYQGSYTFPVASTVERSMQQAANAQAQMFAGLGQEFKGAVDKYFKGKDEKKAAESMSENRIALEIVYGDQGTVPTDPKQRVKDMMGVIRVGGGFENFIKRMENFELREENKAILAQNTTLKRLQIESLEYTGREREGERLAADEYRQFAFTPQRGKLPPKEQGEKEALQRFDPRSRRFPSSATPEPGKVLDPSAFVKIARRRHDIEETRPPPSAPIKQPSARFLDLATESGLSPRASEKAYDIAQQKLKSEQAATTASLARALALTGEVREATKAGQETAEFTQEQQLKDFSGLQVGGESIEGIVGNETEAIKMKDKIAAFNNTLRLFNDLLKFADQREGEWWMSGVDKSEAEALAKMIQSSMREDVLGPGTVQESERKILENIIVNPTTFWSYSEGKAGRDRLDDLKGRLLKRFKEELENKNIRFLGVSAPSSPAGGGETALPSGITGLEIEEI